MVSGTRLALMLWRSPLRSDSAVLLGLRARRETRFTPFGRCAQTVSASQMNEARGYARRPQPCAARRPRNRASRVPPTAQQCCGCSTTNTSAHRQSRGRVCAGSDICGAEERRARGRARSALQLLTRGDCSSEANAVSAVSFATGHEHEYRREPLVQRGAAASERRRTPARGFAALDAGRHRLHLTPESSVESTTPIPERRSPAAARASRPA
jgi:hypothetical protein